MDTGPIWGAVGAVIGGSVVWVARGFIQRGTDALFTAVDANRIVTWLQKNTRNAPGVTHAATVDIAKVSD